MFPDLNAKIRREKLRRNAALQEMKTQSSAAVEHAKNHFSSKHSFESFMNKHPFAVTGTAVVAGLLFSRLFSKPASAEQRVVVEVQHSSPNGQVTSPPEPSFMDKLARGAAMAMSIQQMMGPLLDPNAQQPSQEDTAAHATNGT